MQEKQWIIFGAGQTGRKVFEKLGKERVYCFCDNNISGECCGKKILNLEGLASIRDRDSFFIDIAIDNIDGAFDVKEELAYMGMSYEHWSGEETIRRLLLKVQKKREDIEYIYDASSIHAWRTKVTVQMLQNMFVEYGTAFDDVIDFVIYVADDVYEADRIRQLLKQEKIYAYSTIYGFDKVVAIPDYKFACNFIDGESYYGKAINKMREIGGNLYTDKRAFWGGNLENDKTRLILKKIGEKHADKLFIYDFIYRNGKIQYGKKQFSARQFMDFKYLIDIRGYGWTDRVKYLLGMKRPLLLVDRPYREYYFNRLIPMKHYIPIREDLSDLIEKIEMLETNKDLYETICNNAFKFVLNNFTQEKIREALYKCMYFNNNEEFNYGQEADEASNGE